MARCEYSACSQYGREQLPGCNCNKPDKMHPAYYDGVDRLKSGDELITAERDRQVFDLNYPIAHDLGKWRGNELENSILSLLQGSEYKPHIWGDDITLFGRVIAKPIQVRRVMAGALLCALIDVDNLKYQILINEQKTDPNALRGDKKG